MKKLAGVGRLDPFLERGDPTENALKRSWRSGFDTLWINVCG